MFNTALLIPQLAEECMYALSVELHEGHEWQRIDATKTLSKVMHRMTSRVLIGPRLCRDEHFLSTSMAFMESIFVTGMMFAMIPFASLWRFSHWIISYRHRRKLDVAVAAILPAVEQRLAEIVNNDNRTTALDEMNGLDWTIEMAKLVPAEYNPQRITHHMLHNLWAASAAPGGLVTQMVYQLLMQPEYQTPLLAEAEQAFLKYVMQTPFRFSDGLELPVGTCIAIPALAIQTDPDNFPNPQEFDGFRSERLRLSEEMQSNTDGSLHSATTLTETNLAFGYGKHACPGRFYAVRKVKLMFNGHNDFAIWIRVFYQNRIHNLTTSSPMTGQVDFPRLRQGKLRGQFWSVYMPCPNATVQADTQCQAENLIHDTLQQIDLVRNLAAAFPRRLRLATTADDVWATFASSDAIASLMGVEGLHQIGNSASALRMYHDLGVRYVTLTHDCHNSYADSTSPELPLHNGLSVAGVAMLKEMNRIGMIIDLSHTSAATMRASLNVSTAPVIFSHSSAYALCPHPRNVPDDVLLRVKNNRGVVMVTFYPEYTECNCSIEASLTKVADHIEYIGRLIGYDHVGIGSDFDGMAAGPKGLEDVSKYPSLIKELGARGLSQAELSGVIGRNVLRVLREVELVAKDRKGELPLEDKIEPMYEELRDP
ncbi:hypothetical protein G7Y79_00067g095520 [Physcia stellaris]|nr:hypothetical protein G7Y79_00067g095520 [Physcia stellaris]